MLEVSDYFEVVGRHYNINSISASFMTTEPHGTIFLYQFVSCLVDFNKVDELFHACKISGCKLTRKSCEIEGHYVEITFVAFIVPALCLNQ